MAIGMDALPVLHIHTLMLEQLHAHYASVLLDMDCSRVDKAVLGYFRSALVVFMPVEELVLRLLHAYHAPQGPTRRLVKLVCVQTASVVQGPIHCSAGEPMWVHVQLV